MLLKQLSFSHSISMVDYAVWGLGRKSPNPYTFPHGLEGSPRPGFIPLDDMVNSESVEICEIHIALQELQVVVLMLHRIAFHLSGKIVALHVSHRGLPVVEIE